MFGVVSTETPLTKGEIRVEYETDERIAVVEYDNPRDIDGNVLGNIYLQDDVIPDVILHGVDANNAFEKAVRHFIGSKRFNVTEDIMSSLEIISG